METLRLGKYWVAGGKIFYTNLHPPTNMEKGSCTDNLRFLIILVIVGLGLLTIVTLQDDTGVQGVQPDQIVYHDVRIENLTSFVMNSTVEIYGYQGQNVTLLRQAYDNATPQEQVDMVNSMEIEVLDSTMDALRIMFNGSYAFYTYVWMDVSTIEQDLPPDEPIRIHANSTANLSRTSYNLPEQSIIEDVIYGTLNMGAVVKINVNLLSPANTTTYYIFTPPPKTVIEPGTSGIHGQNNVMWILNNSQGFDPERSENILLKGEFSIPIPDEDIRVTMVLDREQFEITMVHIDIEVHSIDVSRYGNLSDSIVELEYISADGIRMAVDNGLLNYSWERIYEEAILENELEIEAAISEALNVSVELEFNWVNGTISGYDVETMSTEPFIMATLESDDVTPQLYALGKEEYGVDDIKAAKGFLNAGGKAEFDIPQIDLELWVDPTAKIILSPGMRLENFTGTEQLETDNRYGYTWDPRDEFHGRIFSLTAKEFHDSRIDINVTIDVYDINIKWLSWRDSNIKIDVIGDLSFYRIELPDEIKDNLPEGITIDYVIADVLRLAYDTGLINLTEINEMIDNKTEEVEKEIRDSFEENVFLSITIDEDTLVGYDVDDMMDSPSVKIRGYAHISISVGDQLDRDGGDDGDSGDGNGGDGGEDGNGGDGGNRGGSRGMILQGFLYTVLKDWSFDFTMDPLEDWRVTYRLILPRGIVITDISDDLGLARKGTEDGRHYIQVTMTDVENNLTVSVGITPMLFIDVCFLPLAIIVLIIVLLVHRRRTKKRKRKEKERLEEEKLMNTPGTFQNVRHLQERLTELEDEKARLEKEDSKKSRKELKRERKEQKRLEKNGNGGGGSIGPGQPPNQAGGQTTGQMQGFQPPQTPLQPQPLQPLTPPPSPVLPPAPSPSPSPPPPPPLSPQLIPPPPSLSPIQQPLPPTPLAPPQAPPINQDPGGGTPSPGMTLTPPPPIKGKEE